MYRFTLLFILFFLPFTSYAEELNAGIVRGLWYSKNELFVGEPIRIYAAVRNNTEKDLSGTVIFSSNGARIGSLTVNALPGRIVEAWTDWKPTYGNHKITATFVDARILEVGEPARTILVESTLAEDTLFIDHDTDSDGMGDAKDNDDDEDGVEDKEEEKKGTDPLKKDRQEPPTKPQEVEKEEATMPQENQTSSSTPRTQEGLERYTSDSGRIDALLKKTTENINSTKQHLDAYREKRTEDYTKTSEERKIKDDIGFIDRVKIGGTMLLHGIYSLILKVISLILYYPILTQLIVLLIALYVPFKIARRMARRPGF